MILEDATFEKFGYFPSDLKPQSGKRVLMACDKCDRIRIVKKSHYHALCRSCAQKGKSLSEAAKQKRGRPRRERIDEWEFRYLHDVKDMSIREIAGYYGVSHSTAWRYMKEHSIKRHSLSAAKKGNSYGRKYPLNVDFFKAWTQNSAWLYGWFLGDGNYTDHKSLRFGLARVDREVFDKMKKAMNSEHPIVDYKAWDKRYQKYYYGSRILFNSKELVADLKELTIYDVPEEHFRHTLRGFFEAEGSVYQNNGYIGSNIANGNEELLSFIWWYLRERGVVNGGGIYPVNSNCQQLKFSINDSISLYHYMYDACGSFYLQRKKNRFEELLEKRLGGIKA